MHLFQLRRPAPLRNFLNDVIARRDQYFERGRLFMDRERAVIGQRATTRRPYDLLTPSAILHSSERHRPPASATHVDTTAVATVAGCRIKQVQRRAAGRRGIETGNRQNAAGRRHGVCDVNAARQSSAVCGPSNIDAVVVVVTVVVIADNRTRRRRIRTSRFCVDIRDIGAEVRR